MYEELAKIPVPNAADFLNTGIERSLALTGLTTIQVFYSVTDFTKNVKRQMFKYLTVSRPSENSPIPPTTVPTHLEDVSGTVLQRNSSSGKKRVVLRKVSNGNGDSSVSRIVEIWEGRLLEVSMDVTELHGDFYADDFFGSLEFAPSELALVYVAELKASKDDKDPYRKYRFNPDLGEGLVGKSNPTIFLLRWSSSSSPNLFRLNTVGLEDVRFGQPIFDPKSSNVLYATGYELTKDGRMLGIKYCFNRPSGIWRLTVPESSPTDDPNNVTECAVVDTETTQKLTPSHLSCRSPRVRVTGGRFLLIWLSCVSGGAHASTTTLHLLDIGLTSNKIGDELLIAAETPLVGIVQPVKDTDTFPGLYSYIFPSSPFTSHGYDDDRHDGVLLTSQWGSRNTVLRVSLKDGSVKEVTPTTAGKLYSWSILATDGGENFVCSRSAPDVPYEVLLGRFQKNGEVDWLLLDKPNLHGNVANALELIKTKVVPVKDRGFVESIIVQSESSTRNGIVPPCVSFIHGGPHTGSTTAFTPSTTALAIEGYTVSLPNYTGSTGYGEDFLQGLIGRCGDLDVADCIATARYLVKIGISEEGRGKQLIMGGSHGGFLGAHLAGRFSSFFSAAVLRNPVISVSEMSASDIPDWCFSEFGVQYPLSSTPIVPTTTSETPLLPRSLPPLMTTEIFDKLRSSSPIRHVDQISIPVLLLIGKVDRRVIPSQGIEFYHALKARNKKVEMLRFEGESHPLEGVEAAKISFEAAMDWFAQVTDR